MIRITLSLAGCLWALLCVMASTGVLAAGEGDGAEDNLGEIRRKIESTRKTHDALQSLRDTLNHELEEIERRYGGLARSISELETEAAAREKKMAELKQQRDRLQASVIQQQGILAGHLRSAHVIGRKDWLKLLLNQQDPSRFARILAYYGYLNKARSSLIRVWEKNVAEARATEQQLAQESVRQVEVKSRLTSERQELGRASEARRTLLDGWNRELRDEDDRLSGLEEDERRLQELLKSVGNPDAPSELESDNRGNTNPAAKSGQARCPPAGPVEAAFGSPRLNGRWDGIVISALEGSPVRSVAPGRVAFADWLRGYGLLVIVDHGGGVMSLYAFNQTLYKNSGDPVALGDVIAAAGASGGRSRAGLYFGVRDQGKPVDPVAWCARRK